MAAGFAVTGYEDVSRRVARTWLICAGRLVKALLVDRETRRLALGARNRIFTLSKAEENGTASDPGNQR